MNEIVGNYIIIWDCGTVEAILTTLDKSNMIMKAPHLSTDRVSNKELNFKPSSTIIDEYFISYNGIIYDTNDESNLHDGFNMVKR